ncbi:MAG: ATP-dependent metallopeptidase FtsH/Yme1/Tma family protein, partial [Prochloraceae cyanobacterium]|nr:ATP-dependent metallopeptidase FtsH/Yme1/Tma family protein [Prochloraceae cyanobacterium]
MNKDKKWRNAGLYVLLAIVVVALGTAFLDREPTQQTTWKYSQFLQEVESGKVETVQLSSDRAKAIVTREDGVQVLVNIPSDSDLIDTLTDNGVDISVKPQTDDGFLFRALSSLFFPILLLVGLFLLLRRAQSGPGSQAMNFGKSKARVQMEPQTQV